MKALTILHKEENFKFMVIEEEPFKIFEGRIMNLIKKYFDLNLTMFLKT